MAAQPTAHSEATAQASPVDPLPVDTHVHLHPGVDVDAFLAAAARGLARALHPDAPRRGAVCLAERAGVHRFAELRDRADAVLSPSGLGLVIRVHSPASRHPFKLGVLAGRQIVTRERIEVLALGVAGDPIPDGGAAVDVIDAVLGLGGLPVLPYGVGKWLGTRGKLVTTLLTEPRFQPLAVADIAGRPTLGPRPVQLDAAAALARPLLLGTDPLDLPGDHRRIASLGNLVDLEPGLDVWPARLLDRLRRVGPTPRRFGDHLPLHTALSRQIRLRLPARGGRR